MYASDYGYASSDTECRTDLRAGLILKDNKIDNTNVKCKINNWLFKNNGWILTLSPMSNNVSNVYRVIGDGSISESSAYIISGVYPSVYLKSNIKITSGTGEKSNPYKLG